MGIFDHFLKEGKLDLPILPTDLQRCANLTLDRVIDVYQARFKFFVICEDTIKEGPCGRIIVVSL